MPEGNDTQRNQKRNILQIIICITKYTYIILRSKKKLELIEINICQLNHKEEKKNSYFIFIVTCVPSLISIIFEDGSKLYSFNIGLKKYCPGPKSVKESRPLTWVTLFLR